MASLLNIVARKRKVSLKDKFFALNRFDIANSEDYYAKKVADGNNFCLISLGFNLITS